MKYRLDERIRLLASATLAMAVGCSYAVESGSSATPGEAGGQSASAAGGSGGGGAAGGPSTLDCTGIVPLASAEDLAASPRPDADAEWLAVEAGDSFLADEAIYARAHRDLAALRAAHPAFAETHVYGKADGLGPVIAVELTDAAFTLAMSGEWHGWDCLNSTYGAAAPTPWGNGHPPIFSVSLPDRPARHDLLAAQYAELPDVTASFPWSSAGDFPDVCLSIEGDAYAYVFVEPTGLDHCETVCPHHRFTGFRVDAAGAVQELGVHEVDEKTKPRPSAPAWLSGLGACTRWLPACHWGMCD
jgi:hypothetical protein